LYDMVIIVKSRFSVGGKDKRTRFFWAVLINLPGSQWPRAAGNGQ
jgi:hypothetical protein